MNLWIWYIFIDVEIPFVEVQVQFYQFFLGQKIVIKAIGLKILLINSCGWKFLMWDSYRMTSVTSWGASDNLF